MRSRFTLDLEGEGPLHRRIVESIVAAIRLGRLAPGDAIPGSRALATMLGVHRNTVLRAIGELVAEGWVETTPASGTFVTRALPTQGAAGARLRNAPAASAGFPLRGYAVSPEGRAVVDGWLEPQAKGIALYGGIPDLTRVPRAELARAYRRALAGPRVDGLSYSDPRGEPALRRALAAMLADTRGLPNDPERFLITRGSQMALFLAARSLLAPGDVVAVESWGYRPAWEALRSVGAEVRALPVDGEGLVVDALEELCARERVRAVYLTPHHQYPTTVMLSARRRLALLALARRRRLAILEDDYDHEFHYEGRPVLPLASGDGSGNVVYVGTLSKILAPSLRIGFLVATPDVVRRATELRTFVDRQADPAFERAVAELIDEGEVQRHARRMRRVYAERRDAMAEAIHRELGERARFELPPGGLALWVRLAGLDVEAWARRSAEEGVRIHTARRFAFDHRPRPYVRFGYGGYEPAVLRDAIRRLARLAGDA